MSVFDKYCDNNIRDVVQKQLLNKKCADKIYHYTSTKVFDLILETATMRASDIFYLNDSEEYKAGYKELSLLSENHDDKNIKEEIKKITEAMNTEDGKSICGLYTISFSKEKDSLHQWITYAKESGVAFEFDYNVDGLQYLYEQIDEEYNKCELEIVDLLYGEEDKKNFINGVNQLIDKIIKNQNDDWSDKDVPALYNMLIRIAVSYIKNDKFEDEKEARITITPNMAGNKEYKTKIRYFPMESGILRPYINLKICDNNDEPCLPVKSITIGPSGIQQTVFDSVVHRIKYGECKVYNYLIDKQKLVKNFSDYLFEVYVYCKENNLKGNYNLKFSDCAYNEEGTLSENIINTFNSLTLEQMKSKEESLDQTKKLREWICEPKNKNLIIALINNWIEENRTLISSYYRIEEESHVETEKELKEMLTEINQNLYFSKEGILIRKSKIPYIF